MTKVLITGANGFLGSNLCAYFAKKGWQVEALVHNMPQTQVAGVSYHLFDLAEEPEQGYFEGTDYLIHAAYIKLDAKHDAYELNIEGSQRLLAMSKKCGVKKNIFISSIASREDALSIYGMQKYACEKLFKSATDLVLRPGLILGNGGLFAQLKDYLQKSRFIPLISGGKQPMQTIHIDDITLAIDKCIEKDLTGILPIASTETMNNKEFYKIVCANIGTKPFFIYLPFGIIFTLLSITETIGITLAVSRENLLGLKKMSYVDISESLSKLDITVRNCAESLNILRNS